MAPPDPQPERPGADLARTTFAVLFIGALMATTLWVLRPFLGPAVWAAMVVVATWPLMLRVQARLWGRRTLAVTVMTLLLLLLFVVPLTLAIVTIVGNADELIELGKTVTHFHLPAEPPAWMADLPLVGGLIQRGWLQARALGVSDLLPRLSPYAGDATKWFVAQVGSVGFLLLQFLMIVVIAAVMYATGEEAALLARRFAQRLGGDRGIAVVDLAGGAIRGVAMGVGVTAAVQAVLSGVGLAIVGVPVAGLLTAVTFMLCIAQIGPVPVLLPAAIWAAFFDDNTAGGIFLLVLTAIVTTLDNVLRPMLIRMGADLPLLLIFSGVIGGLLAFGLVGIFVGPVVLAVAYTLMEAWIADGENLPQAGASAARAPAPSLTPPQDER